MGNPNLKEIITQNFPFYAFRDVDVRGGAPIDPELQGLIVTQPSSDLGDAELARIDEFVLRGKSVVFFAGAANVERGDVSMHATLSTHGLDRLLGGYGIELRRDLVVELDPTAAYSVAPTAPGGARVVVPFVPLVLDARLDAAFPAFFRMDMVAFPLPSSLVLHREKQPEATLRELARSSPRAVRVTGADVDLHPLAPWSPAGPGGAAVLAVAAEGILRGAFDASRRSTGRARVLVVASSQFLSNPLARAWRGGDESLAPVATKYAQDELTSMILVFKDTLDWLSFEDYLVDCKFLPGARH
jgi:ABC-type uncharacterized transport system involved in gliding motility auxiliary subunit